MNEFCRQLANLAGCLFLAFCLGGGVARAQTGEIAGDIGTVTLKLGEAWVAGSDGQRRAAVAAMAVKAGDVIETGASGHLHVRFVDGAVVSVRPESRLAIVEYRDPAAGGAIRFQFQRGTVRSITGRWGEAERDRFRLNTPIAAIGISGTDFVVQGDPGATRVIVLRGGIIAAPYSESCRPDDLGPCGGGQARALTAAMGALMLEIKAGDVAPALIPRNSMVAAEEARRTAETSVPTKTEAITQVMAQEVIPVALPATLAWGRWAHAPAWPDDTLSLSREEAAQGRERVAENGRYVLYRLPQNGPLPATGVVNFGLSAAQAHFINSGGALPAQVTDGRLALDFGARRFATALTLEAAATGKVPFSAGGVIAPDGSFSQIELKTRVRGAWGAGGSGPSAAYLFEQTTPQGMFMGITQWR